LDEDGIITNYDELMNQYLDKFNAGKISEEKYEEFKKAM
jgi:hypothetical protein